MAHDFMTYGHLSARKRRRWYLQHRKRTTEGQGPFFRALSGCRLIVDEFPLNDGHPSTAIRGVGTSVVGPGVQVMAGAGELHCAPQGGYGDGASSAARAQGVTFPILRGSSFRLRF